MKASELIIEIQKAIDAHGDLSVVVWADHGQTQITCLGAGMEPQEDAPEHKVIEIWGDGNL